MLYTYINSTMICSFHFVWCLTLFFFKYSAYKFTLAKVFSTGIALLEVFFRTNSMNIAVNIPFWKIWFVGILTDFCCQILIRNLLLVRGDFSDFWKNLRNNFPLLPLHSVQSVDRHPAAVDMVNCWLITFVHHFQCCTLYLVREQKSYLCHHGRLSQACLTLINLFLPPTLSTSRLRFIPKNRDQGFFMKCRVGFKPWTGIG